MGQPRLGRDANISAMVFDPKRCFHWDSDAKVVTAVTALTGMTMRGVKDCESPHLNQAVPDTIDEVSPVDINDKRGHSLRMRLSTVRIVGGVTSTSMRPAGQFSFIEEERAAFPAPT